MSPKEFTSLFKPPTPKEPELVKELEPLNFAKLKGPSKMLFKFIEHETEKRSLNASPVS